MIEPFNPADRYKDPGLEASVIVALLQAQEAASSALEVLNPSCFSHDEYRAVYEALAAGTSPDVSGIEEADPPADLMEAALSLKELASKRNLLEISREIREDVKAGKPSEEILSMLEASVLEEKAQALPDIFRPMTRAFSGLLEDYERKQQRREELGNVGLNTHIPSLNTLLGGLQPGIHTLAAPPGMGKTTLVLQLGGHISAEGYPVLFLSFEESLNRLTLKALCQAGGLDLKAFTDGKGKPEELLGVMDYHGQKLDRLYIMEGRPGITVTQVKAKMLQAMKEAQQKHGLIIVDYLQIWAASQRDGKSKGDFRHEVSGLISELRRLSIDLQIPILAISSQSRGAYKDGITSDDLSSLKESGELEYTADTAWFLIDRESPGSNPKNKALTLSITKNRFGETGKIPLLFMKSKGKITEEGGETLEPKAPAKKEPYLSEQRRVIERAWKKAKEVRFDKPYLRIETLQALLKEDRWTDSDIKKALDPKKTKELIGSLLQAEIIKPYEEGWTITAEDMASALRILHRHDFENKASDDK